MIKSKNILICPLEWGLGHAARMIPVARKLRDSGNNIFIGSGEKHLSLFKSEMTGLNYITFPGFKPFYSGIIPQYIVLLLQTPYLLYHIILEHFKLKKIISRYDIDIVISDNRFGLWNSKVVTAYVTHMPLLPLPKPLRFLEFIGVHLHRAVINRYSICLIPDLPGEMNISGKLSHGIKLPEHVRYTGILSRFLTDRPSSVTNPAPFPHNTVILSGPEPQRGILKQKLVSLLKDKIPFTIIFEGKPYDSGKSNLSGNIIFYSHLPASEMKEVISGSERIISRSGYTTIMDLIALRSSALLIPTPGQTEQEYLAAYLSGKGWFITVSQNETEKGLLLSPLNATWSGEIIKESKMLLEKALVELLQIPDKNSKYNKSGKEAGPYLPGGPVTQL